MCCSLVCDSVVHALVECLTYSGGGATLYHLASLRHGYHVRQEQQENIMTNVGTHLATTFI